ncbi:hypothetical protein [Qipengyuania spongiae]|uniref:Tetratricopeptide repeat protein n=1 Tax=Qipengyuania spongiae TaxID=2909673 RepID=A0ABY5SYL2_9SPHN|nr:hypothetical protein [Qipengyuania spongiae]UVI39260.1 hypothetical protein L1F33_13675 [Qipengyuania spongiae]
MSILVSALVALAAQSAAPAMDVATEELVAGRDAAAIATIMTNDRLEETDPARLINLGVAHARKGDNEQARRYFEAAMQADGTLFLETTEGQWIKARRIAARSLAMLNRGEFADQTLVASR